MILSFGENNFLVKRAVKLRECDQFCRNSGVRKILPSRIGDHDLHDLPDFPCQNST